MKEINGIKLYSTKEISEMLSVSLRFVYDKMDRGLLARVRVGRGYFVSEEALANYLNGKTQDKTKQEDQEQQQK